MNKILIIEDDLEINALLADFLKEKGYAVHCQYDGLHVLDFLNKEKIDLIILDIMLPYRSGDIILSVIWKSRYLLQIDMRYLERLDPEECRMCTRRRIIS